MTRFKVLATGFTSGLFGAILFAQTTPAPQLRVITDATGALVTVVEAQTNPLSNPTPFNQTRLRTDASNRLITVAVGSGTLTQVNTTSPITGGPITTTGTIACATCGVTSNPLSQFASTTSAQLAGVLSDETGSGLAVFGTSPSFTTTATLTRDNLQVASTDGVILQNTTASTLGIPVQFSPRIKLSGTAFNSVSGLSETDYIITDLRPATAAGVTTFNWLVRGSLNGAAEFTILTINSSGATTLGGGLGIPAVGYIEGVGRTILKWPADGQLNIINNAESIGIQFNGSTAAPTFNNGTVTTGSRNVAGQITLTGGNTGGIITFGGTAWTNAPFCTLTGSAATDIPQITAVATTSLTVAGITANGVFTFLCIGRI